MHRGKELHRMLRQSGYSLSTIAKKLHMSRNTFYARLRCEEPDEKFILALEEVLNCHFSSLFPQVKRPEYREKVAMIRRFERGYIEVMERFIALVGLAVEAMILADSEEDRLRIAHYLKENVKAEKRCLAERY